VAGDWILRGELKLECEWIATRRLLSILLVKVLVTALTDRQAGKR